MANNYSRGNPKAPSSPRQVQAAAAAGLTAAALGNQLTVEIVLHIAGTLTYVNKDDVTITLSIALPAGRYAIEAKSITSNSSDITCFMGA